MRRGAHRRDRVRSAGRRAWRTTRRFARARTNAVAGASTRAPYPRRTGRDRTGRVDPRESDHRRACRVRRAIALAGRPRRRCARVDRRKTGGRGCSGTGAGGYGYGAHRLPDRHSSRRRRTSAGVLHPGRGGQRRVVRCACEHAARRHTGIRLAASRAGRPGAAGPGGRSGCAPVRAGHSGCRPARAAAHRRPLVRRLDRARDSAAAGRHGSALRPARPARFESAARVTGLARAFRGRHAAHARRAGGAGRGRRPRRAGRRHPLPARDAGASRTRFEVTSWII